MSREDAFSSAIVTINEKGIIQSVDKNCCNLFGYTPEQLLNQDVVALIPPPYKEQHSSYLRNYHETGVAKIIGKSRVVEGLHSSGTIFPILLSISSVNVGDTKLYVAMIDKLEDKAGIITSNLEGTIVSCNQHCEAMFGYKVSELIGQNLKMLMPPPYSDLHDTYIKNYHATGRESVIGKVRNLVAKHKNGVVFPICLQVHRINIGLVELFRGRIERLDTDIEAVFTLNDEGYIVSCNKTFVVPFFGYSDEELIGQHINKLFVSFYSKISAPEKAQPTKRRRVEGSGSQRSRDTIEWRIRDVRTAQVIHKDGSSFSVLVSVDKFTNGPGEVAQQYSIKIRRLPEGGSSSDDIARSLRGSSTSGSDSSSDIVGNWILGEKIGQGSYGRVKLATHKHSGLQAAVKILQLDMMDDQEIDRSRREIEIMKQLEHPNICKILDVVESGDKLFIVMEYGAGGELQSFQKQSIGEPTARRLFLQILAAIDYCHNRNIIHRDIKHRNILLDADSNVKLIDFGLSNFTSGHLRSTFCGTPAYAAPEMILGKKYIGPEVDVWSMGVVLYSMLTNKFPFKDVSTIISGKYRHPRNVSPACADLLKKMLMIDPTHRATIAEVKNHPWVLGKGTESFLPNSYENDAPDSDEEESDSHSFDSVSFERSPPGGCPVAHITGVVNYPTSFLKGQGVSSPDSRPRSGGGERGGCLFGFDRKRDEGLQSPVTIDCSSHPSPPPGGCPVIHHASVITTTTTTSRSSTSVKEGSYSSTTSSNGLSGELSRSNLASSSSPLPFSTTTPFSSSSSTLRLPSASFTSSFIFHPPLPTTTSSTTTTSSSSTLPPLPTVSPNPSYSSSSSTPPTTITAPAATTTAAATPSTTTTTTNSEPPRPPSHCPFPAASLPGSSTTTTT